MVAIGKWRVMEKSGRMGIGIGMWKCCGAVGYDWEGVWDEPGHRRWRGGMCERIGQGVGTVGNKRKRKEGLGRAEEMGANGDVVVGRKRQQDGKRRVEVWRLQVRREESDRSLGSQAMRERGTVGQVVQRESQQKGETQQKDSR